MRLRRSAIAGIARAAAASLTLAAAADAEGGTLATILLPLTPIAA